MKDKTRKKRSMSLRSKIVIAIVVMALVIAGASVGVSYLNYQSAMNEYYETMGTNVARTAVAQMENQGNVSVYLSVDYLEETNSQLNATDFSAAEEVEGQSNYITILNAMTEVVEANDALAMYVVVPTNEGVYYLFDTTPTENAGHRYYGEFDAYADSAFAGFAEAMSAGNAIAPVVSNTYGVWQMSISYHAETSPGTSYYLCVSLDMNDVRADQTNFLITMVGILAAIVVVFLIIYLILFNIILVSPIKKMTKAAADFIDEGTTSGASSIGALKVRTGDELQKLSESLKKMEDDINNYINNLYYYTAEQERMGTELSIATQIQADMLPSTFPAFPEHDEFDIYATMDPAKEVGGDFYDFFMVDDKHLAIVVADVSSKGVPAALFMVIAKTLIKDHTQQLGTDLGKVFTKVNNLLCDSNNEGMFVTAFEGVLNLETGELTYVNAGHELPFIYRKSSGEFKPFKIRAGFVLAGMDGLKYRAGTMQLEEGDKLFQYTDGVTEATTADKLLYGMQRLEAVLNANTDKSMQELLLAVRRDIDAFVGDAEQFDDITMLGLEFKKKQRKSEDKNVKEITLDAVTENLAAVTDFINDELGKYECSPKTIMQLDIAIDEIFGNIVNYAYTPNVGKVTVQIRVDKNTNTAHLTFIDSGVKYNPLEKDDPDVSLSAEERKIGGLGIFLVKKSMDDMTYEYKDGKNMLTISKKL